MMLIYSVTSLRYGRYSERLPEGLGEVRFDISEERSVMSVIETLFLQEVTVFIQDGSSESVMGLLGKRCLGHGANCENTEAEYSVF